MLADIVLTQRPQVQKILADFGDRGFFEEVVTEIRNRAVEFLNKIVREFVIQPKRWIVGRTLA